MSEIISERLELPCTIMRGGTSKGLILRQENLPAEQAARDRVLLRLFGSPDSRQIDGLGGADPLTSKVAIVGKPTRPDADIDYTFGQVGIRKRYVDFAGYCGNILASVAAYAVDEGFVRVDGDSVEIRVHTTNAGRIVRAKVPVRNGCFRPDGDLAIAGVPGRASAITLDFADTAGSVSGRVFPSGRTMDVIDLPGHGPVEVSIVDVGNPMIFARLADFGIEPSEGPDELDPKADLIERLDSLRRLVAEAFGLTMTDGCVSENIPLPALVGPAHDYSAYGSGEPVNSGSVDFISREFFAGRLHKAYGIGETVCTAAAAMMEGTVVHGVAGKLRTDREVVCFGHPSGRVEVDIEIGRHDGKVSFNRIAVRRTARRLLDGVAYLDFPASAPMSPK